jgi:hypothetical protein
VVVISDEVVVITDGVVIIDVVDETDVHPVKIKITFTTIKQKIIVLLNYISPLTKHYIAGSIFILPAVNKMFSIIYPILAPLIYCHTTAVFHIENPVKGIRFSPHYY